MPTNANGTPVEAQVVEEKFTPVIEIPEKWVVVYRTTRKTWGVTDHGQSEESAKQGLEDCISVGCIAHIPGTERVARLARRAELLEELRYIADILSTMSFDIIDWRYHHCKLKRIHKKILDLDTAHKLEYLGRC